MEVHICWTQYDEEKVEQIDCPTCESKQDALCQLENWYGWTVTCLNCGDRWMDSELCPRPFHPKWREERIANAKKKAIELGWKEPEIKQSDLAKIDKDEA